MFLTRFAAFPALLFLPLFAEAQPALIAPPSVVEAPQFPPQTAQIEPAARILLETLAARYGEMNSYSDTMTMSGFFGSSEAKIQWQRPSRARVEAKVRGKAGFGLNDGTTLWALRAEHPGHYVKRASDSDRIFDAASEAGVGAPGFSLMQLDARRGNDVLADLHRDGLTKLEMGAPDEFEGAPMQTLKISLAFNDGHDSVMTLLIGQKDGLIHQIQQSYSGVGSITETHRDICVNPVLPPETWQWKPPDGSQPIDYFHKLEPDRHKPAVKVGQILPNFKARDLAGQAVSLLDLESKTVVLHFFSIDNGQGLIELMDVQKQFGAQKLAAIGVCMDGRRERVEAWAKENKITLPILFDERGSNNPVATLYGVRSWATTLLIDPQGVLQSVELSPYDPALSEKIRGFTP